MPGRRAQSQHFVADLLKEIELIALVVDAGGRIRSATSRLEDMLACEQDALCAMPFDAIFSPRNPDWISHEARKAAAAGSWSGDAVLRRRDGTECWAHVQACRLPADDPSKADLLFVFEDTTEHVEVVSALMRRTEELYDLNWELEATNRIGRLHPASDDLNAYLYALLREAVRCARADGGWVLLRDVEANSLVCRVVTARTPKSWLVGYVLPLDQTSLASETFNSRRTLLVKDVDSHPVVDLDKARVIGAKSALSTPICVGDEALGVMMLATRRIKEFTREEIILVEAVANQAALAIQNASPGERRAA